MLRNDSLGGAGGFGDSGFRYGRHCGLQTCRPVENDLLLRMRRTNVSWDVGDNSCLVDRCDVVTCKGQAAVSICTLQFDSKRAPFRGIHSVQDACPLFVLDRSRSGFHSTVQLDTLLQQEFHPFPNTVAHTYKIHVQRASDRLCNEEPITTIKQLKRSCAFPYPQRAKPKEIETNGASLLNADKTAYMDTPNWLFNEDAVCK